MLGEMERYTQLFQTALVYTVSVQLLDHVITTTTIQSLPIIILTLMGATTLAFKLAEFLRSATLGAALGFTPWPSALNLITSLLTLATEVLVQFISTAVGRFTLYAFSTSQDDSSTAVGVFAGVTLIYALKHAIHR